MPLKNRQTGKLLPSTVKQLRAEDYQWLNSSLDFQFDWTSEKENEVYKICLVDETATILGVMSLIDVPEEFRIHLNLIEVADTQRGKKKTIDNVAGCLLAFACRLAFSRGYLGFVSLQPKTKLIRYYQSAYGFRQYGRLLGIEQDGAIKLIQKYLEDEKE
ncbi:GNAT family N-acetyltransferase [Neolewinella xylanilytica]|nr:GNAT family N-acetyltransferase [Neolewinella xylanilytica]